MKESSVMRAELRRLLYITILAVPFSLGFGLKNAVAQSYPVTVIDMAGRQVTITRPPERVALQDGRVALDLALLDRTDPFSHVVIWNNLLSRFSPAFWSLLVKHWPEAAKIPDMGFDDDGQVNLEAMLAKKPQILIAELRAMPVLEQDGTMRTFAALHIPVLFVDDSVHPVPNAVRSVTLLGTVLDRAKEAKAYTDFYDAHLANLTTTIAKLPAPHPSVFVEALAGQSDAGDCCFTHGNFGWGLLVQAVGARNLGSELLHSPSGQVSVETLLADQPDVFVMTGRGQTASMPVLGYATSTQAAERSLRALETRPGLAALMAAQNNRVYGLYHPFYSSVFNIVGLEYLAKFIYPGAFVHLDPLQTYATLISQFTTIPNTPVLFGLRAPALDH
jgi:iron complex transport system substrate-binding protein